MTTLAEPRPEVAYDDHKPGEYVYDAYRHEDGSITYIVQDMDGEHANPRQDDGNLCVLVQENDRYLQPDNPCDVDERLKEARDRFDNYGRRGTTYRAWGRAQGKRHDREDMVQRYIRIFRPDILHYADWISIGQDGYGWGYVPKAVWDEHMIPTLADDATDEQKQAWLDYTPSVTPAEAFKSELSVYEQWCNGEVYGAIHVSIDEPIVVLGEHGAYVDGYTTKEDSCWGFLGYDDRKEIAADFTDSPITEVLY